MDRGLVEHLAETGNESMFIWIFMHLWNPINIWQIEFVLIWIYSKGSENRFVVVQHFWCRKICKIVCRVPRKRVKSKFLYQDADVILLADKCIVVRSFVCRNYDKVLMETGKFSDNRRVTENGLVSGVDRAFKCFFLSVFFKFIFCMSIMCYFRFISFHHREQSTGSKKSVSRFL